jgi:hypothetical protein
MKARIKPGHRPGWGRIDLDEARDMEYIVDGLRLKPTRIGRFQKPCLIFPLQKDMKVGDEVEVEMILRCRLCGMFRASLINGMCDDCYEEMVVGVPLLVAVLYAAGEGEDSRPQGRDRAIR